MEKQDLGMQYVIVTWAWRANTNSPLVINYPQANMIAATGYSTWKFDYGSAAVAQLNTIVISMEILEIWWRIFSQCNKIIME